MVAHAREKIWREPIWREPMWREQDLSMLTLQVYVPQAEYPVVGSYMCRDHRSVQHSRVNGIKGQWDQGSRGPMGSRVEGIKG